MLPVRIIYLIMTVLYVNDPHDVSIKLQEEWLTELLKKEAYNLSGDKASDLEKVYIQEYLHYFNAPIDQYVNIMRSGVPMKNSFHFTA